MKIKLEKKIKQIDGKVIKNEDNTTLFLKDVLVNTALQETDKEDQNKLSDFQIALKIQNAGKEVELTTKEIVRLQEKVKKGFTRLIVGQVNELLEGKENPIK